MDEDRDDEDPDDHVVQYLHQNPKKKKKITPNTDISL
jgi:hypothetical protein